MFDQLLADISPSSSLDVSLNNPTMSALAPSKRLNNCRWWEGPVVTTAVVVCEVDRF